MKTVTLVIPNKIKNVITVCGTNGKYSTIKSLQSILNQAGYKTNQYLSPHLTTYTERYVYGDKEIKKNDLSDLLNEIEKMENFFRFWVGFMPTRVGDLMRYLSVKLTTASRIVGIKCQKGAEMVEIPIRK